jgi:hypothetical protein
VRINLASERESFAAKRKKVLADAEESLLGSAKAALRRFGEDDWFEPLVRRAESLARATYRDEAGQATSNNLKAEVRDLGTRLRAAMEKTAEPAPGDIPVRARAIAASIATAAVSTGLLAAALDEDNAEELGKVWLSMDDDRVRPTHKDADQQVVPLGGKFTVGGVEMDRPGDMSAPLEEWINCRCILGVELLEQPQSRTAAGTLVAANPAGADMPDDELTPPAEPIDIAEAVPFHTVLAPEGVLSGDGRMFAADSLRMRDLPLTLHWQKSTEPGHDGAVAVARIDTVARVDGQMRGTGFFAATPEADEVVALIADSILRGVSIDADDAVMEMQTKDGQKLEDLLADLGEDEEPEFSMQDMVTVFTDARICGATICSIPAFQEAFIALGEAPAGFMGEAEAESTDEPVTARKIDSDQRKKDADEGKALPDGSFPIENVEDLKNAIRAIGRAKDPAKAKAHIKKRAHALGHDELVPDDWSAETVEFVKTEDGPGWLTHPVDTDRLRDYWVHGKGAAKINWGTPGDFNRCRAALAAYVKPQHLSGYCANRHYDALGFWPGRPVSAMTEPFTDAGIHLVASVEPVVKPPRSWFDDPHLTGPSPVVVTEEGRVFGHLAEWGTCHIGFDGVCIEPPPSMNEYANFLTGGYVLCDDGSQVRVGHLTMDTGHAGPRASARVAAAHYDNTGFVVSDVNIGEDEFGPWVAGYIRPGTPPEKVAAMRASALSGDWRDVRGTGELELVAALVVNVPGFPIIAPTLAASGGRQTSLVAAGVIRPHAPVVQQDIKDIVKLAITEYEAGKVRRSKMERLRAENGLDPKSQMKALAASVERN